MSESLEDILKPVLDELKRVTQDLEFQTSALMKLTDDYDINHYTLIVSGDSYKVKYEPSNKAFKLTYKEVS